MKGDIFSRSTGCKAEGDVFNNCCGDVFKASGDISTECVMKLPYPDARMEQLLNMLSVARKNEADAHQERDKAIKDWQECKRKLFCNAAPKNRTLNEKEVIWDASRVELSRAEAEVQQAIDANGLVQQQYNECVSAQKDIFAQQSEMQSAMDVAATEKAKVEVQQTMASTESLKEKKDFLLYGLIGLGAVSVLFFGYKLIK